VFADTWLYNHALLTDFYARPPVAGKNPSDSGDADERPGRRLSAERLSRRRFLRRVALGGLGLAAATGGYEFLPRLRVGEAAKAAATVQRFVSEPGLSPPVVDVITAASGTSPGYVFLAPSSGPGQRGVMILDSKGDVVWFHATSPRTAMNFRPAVYRGAPVLAWWESLPGAGLGNGHHRIVDASYRQIASFPAGGGRPADLHELQITSRGTALVSALESRRMDLRAVGGTRRGLVLGGVAQELEIPSARVLWEWRSIDHVSVTETYSTKIGYPWDYFHINSIDVGPDGDLLISGRNVWGIYKISREKGNVLWRLGGKRSDFTLGRGARFAFQHDARHVGDAMISLFDNGGAESVQIESQSRGLQLRLDFEAMHAAVDREWTHDPPLYGRLMGNMQLLPNGNRMTGWGGDPHFTEFAADGGIRFDATLPRGGESYRAFRFPWRGRPDHPPVAAVGQSPAGRSLFASWNGSTALAAWRLEAGGSRTSLTPQTTVAKAGFETALLLPHGVAYAAAVALDAEGTELARTATAAV
jgi:hypothetical protein